MTRFDCPADLHRTLSLRVSQFCGTCQEKVRKSNSLAPVILVTMLMTPLAYADEPLPYCAVPLYMEESFYMYGE